MHHDLGDKVRLEVEFTDLAGALTDPTTVTVEVRLPDGTTVSGTWAGAAVIRSGAGVFYYDFATTARAEGYYHYRFIGTGAVEEVFEDAFELDQTVFAGTTPPRWLVGFDELKDHLKIELDDNDGDRDLAVLLDGVSDLFHSASGREFKVSGTNPVMRRYDVTDRMLEPYEGYRWLEVDDLASAPTDVTIRQRGDLSVVQVVPTASYVPMPRTRRFPWQPFEELGFIEGAADAAQLSSSCVVDVTATWGFPVVPDELKLWVFGEVGGHNARDVKRYGEAFNLETGRLERPKRLTPPALEFIRSFRRTVVS